MADLTTEQIQAIRRIIADHHYAFTVNTVGPSAVPPEILEDLKARGLISTTTQWPEKAYQYGQALAATHDPKLATMSPGAFKQWLVVNPVALSTAERRALQYAELQAAQWITNMAEQVRSQVVVEVMQSIATRGTEGELKTNLGNMVGDWNRNWNRVAVTEKHRAMQGGYADELGEQYGEDALVAVRHMGDACFAPGTPVLTRRGEISIERVTEGDEVLTHKMRWRRVTATMHRWYNGDLYGFNGRTPSTTANHPMLCNLDWGRADSVKRGDHLIGVPRRKAQNNPPIGDEKLFLHDVAPTNSATRMPTSSVQLHGYLQMRDSDIDVEFTHGEFKDGAEVCESLTQSDRLRGSRRQGSLPRKGLRVLHFWCQRQAAALARILRVFPTLLRGQASHTPALAFGLGDPGQTPRQHTPMDDTRRNTQLTRGRGDGVSAVKQSDQLSPVDTNVLWHEEEINPYVEKVNTIHNEAYIGPVYNLEVDGDHTYVADGLVVHNCKHCRRLYGGQGDIPKTFKLSELRENGNNVGRKAADWLPVLPPAHPHCFLPGTLVRTVSGMARIEDLVPGVLVQTSQGWEPVTHTWASNYDGEVVQIQQDDGALFSVTPNHPFRLGTDWIPAGDIKEGDDVSGFEPNPAGSVLLNDTEAVDRPTLAGEKVGFARVLFGLSGRGVPISAVHLDGQLYVREGEINQETADLITREGRSSESYQGVIDPALVGTAKFTSVSSYGREDEFLGLTFPSDGSVEGGEVRTPLFWRKFGHADPLSIGVAPLDVARFFDARHNRTVSNPEPGSYVFHREQIVEVKFDDDGSVEFAPPRVSIGFGHTPPVPTTHRIVNVNSVPYSGLVHNLTVGTSHEYVVGDTLTHNCQCQTIYIPKGWAFDAEGELVPASMLDKSLDGVIRNFSGSKSSVAIAAAELTKAYKDYGTIDFQGFKIRIENPVGTERHWKDENGEEGTTRMLAAYGYFEGTVGADDEELDCYVGPHPHAPYAYIVHQQNPKNGIYDEDKVMLGCRDKDHALALYQAHYDGQPFAIAVSEIEMEQLRRWTADHTPQQHVLKLDDLTKTVIPGNMVPTNKDEGAPSMYAPDAFNILFDAPQTKPVKPDRDIALVILNDATWNGERRVDHDVMEQYLVPNATMNVQKFEYLDHEDPDSDSEQIKRNREEVDQRWASFQGDFNKVIEP